MQGIGRYTKVKLSRWSKVYAWIGIGIHRLKEEDQYPEQFSLDFSKPFITCFLVLHNFNRLKGFYMLFNFKNWIWTWVNPQSLWIDNL